MDSHIDSLKQEFCFKENDIVLDLFCGSGTTLAVANELKIHALGVDISIFNTILANAKIRKYDLKILEYTIDKMLKVLEIHFKNSKTFKFEDAIDRELNKFNRLYFPSKEFKRKVSLKEVDERIYGEDKAKKFLKIYNDHVKRFDINLTTNSDGNFFDKWYIESIQKEILLLNEEIDSAPKDLQDILKIILSRTARSCRATTHSDLATLIKPIKTSYYCIKHGRICKPIFSASKWFKRYSQDTMRRLREFDALRTESKQICLNGDSRNIDLLSSLLQVDSEFATLLKKQKIAGIFSSPPYVGLIDYHEQHAYSYDIFDLPRKDCLEIGKMSEGQNKIAQEKYIQSIADALKNARKFLKDDYDIFLVANDKFNLYPEIARLADMRIVKIYNRPVINRSEKNQKKYSESIFHLKDKQ